MDWTFKTFFNFTSVQVAQINCIFIYLFLRSLSVTLKETVAALGSILEPVVNALSQMCSCK